MSIDQTIVLALRRYKVSFLSFAIICGTSDVDQYNAKLIDVIEESAGHVLCPAAIESIATQLDLAALAVIRRLGDRVLASISSWESTKLTSRARENDEKHQALVALRCKLSAGLRNIDMFISDKAIGVTPSQAHTMMMRLVNDALKDLSPLIGRDYPNLEDLGK